MYGSDTQCYNFVIRVSCHQKRGMGSGGPVSTPQS